MKKRIIAIVILAVMSVSVLSSCGKKDAEPPKPELSQVQSICNLATLECYYHTVGKIVKNKTDDQQIIDFMKRDRTVWIEYTGIARVGVDMTKVKIDVKGESVQITMPEAELLSLIVDPESYNEDSFYISEDDWLVKNKITADVQSQAIDNGQEEMRNAILSNTALMKNAQIRAQKLIKNYIEEIGEAAGVTYKITWLYEDGSKSNEIDDGEADTP